MAKKISSIKLITHFKDGKSDSFYISHYGSHTPHPDIEYNKRIAQAITNGDPEIIKTEMRIGYSEWITHYDADGEADEDASGYRFSDETIIFEKK